MRVINYIYPQFFDNNGTLLDNGNLYFGDENLNPETNPIAVFWDAAGTIPAAQPVRTLNGLVCRSGTPSDLYIDDDYSLTVKDSNHVLVYYKASSATPLPQGATQTVDNIEGLRDILKTASIIYIIVAGYYAPQDGGGGLYWLDVSDTTTADNGGTVIVADDGGRWFLINTGDTFSVKQFGARGNGITNDAPSFAAALTACTGYTVFVPPGSYHIDQELRIPAGTVLKGDGRFTSTLIHGTSVTAYNLITTVGANATVCDLAINGNYLNIPSFALSEIGAGAGGSTIKDNFVYGMRGLGISGGTNFTKIQGNTIIGAASTTIGSYGIWAIVNAAVGQEISGNIVVSTLLDGIGASGIDLKVFNNFISNCQCNTAFGGGQLAIYPGADNTTFADVYDNYIAAPGSALGAGIELNGWCHVHHNTVDSQKGAGGIILQAGDQNIVNNNIVKNTTGPGISVTGALNNFTICDNTCFDDQSVKTQTYGIILGAFASSFFVVADNKLYGNLTAGLLDSTTGNPTKKVTNNAGYAVASVLTVGASPYTYTNTRGEAVVLSIYGGTVSSVVAAGRAAAAATNVQVIVHPTTTAVVTYSSLPGIDEIGLTY